MPSYYRKKKQQNKDEILISLVDGDNLIDKD